MVSSEKLNKVKENLKKQYKIRSHFTDKHLKSYKPTTYVSDEIVYSFYGDEFLDLKKKTFETGKIINVMLYNICNTQGKPFIQYLGKIVDKHITNILYKIEHGKNSYIDIEKHILSSLKHKTSIKNITYSGYYKYDEYFEGSLINQPEYIFFNCECDDNIYEHNRKSIYEWCLPMEFYLTRGNDKYFDKKITKDLSHFFINNDVFMYLQDENLNTLEVPYVGYYNNDKKDVEKVIKYGFYRKKINDSGEKYYILNRKPNLSKSMIRCAMFVGNEEFLDEKKIKHFTWDDNFDSFLISTPKKSFYLLNDMNNIKILNYVYK